MNYMTDPLKLSMLNIEIRVKLNALAGIANQEQIPSTRDGICLKSRTKSNRFSWGDFNKVGIQRFLVRLQKMISINQTWMNNYNRVRFAKETMILATLYKSWMNMIGQSKAITTSLRPLGRLSMQSQQKHLKVCGTKRFSWIKQRCQVML